MSRGLSRLQVMIIKLLTERGEKTVYGISARLLEKPYGELDPSLSSLWRSLRLLQKRDLIERVVAHYADTHHLIYRYRIRKG